jgi:hypothetical protein
MSKEIRMKRDYLLFAMDHRALAAHPSLEAIDKLHQPQVQPRFSFIVSAVQAVIGPPVHAPRPIGKFLQHVRAAPELHANSLCFPEASMVQRFVLALIRQPIAASARKQFAGTVEQRDSAPAVLTAGIDGTYEPGAMTAKMARRPGDWHPLFHRLPFGLSVASPAIHQDHGVHLGTHADIAGRLSTARP